MLKTLSTTSRKPLTTRRLKHTVESMFSNDQNIETIGQLVDVLKHYAGLQKEYIKLGTVEKTVRILTAIAMTAILGLLLVFVLIFLSFAVVSALSNCLGQVAAFSIVAGVYFLVFLLFIIFRKSWIEKPLVRFLSGLLLS